jgi:hypothetical protein
MLGRVFGALTALAQAGIPIGAVLAGVVVQQVGLVPTILGMGAIYLAVKAIDTTTPDGKLVFHVFAALAEFERESDPGADQC